MDRLVLGCGTAGLSLVERLADRPGTPLVLVDDERRAESLREDSIDARTLDITDVHGIRTVAGDVDSVIVAPESAERVRPAVETARDAYPDAFVFAVLDAMMDREDRNVVEGIANRTVDAEAETASHLVERAGDKGVRTRKLKHILRSVDGTLAVVAHDNPDPDAIASAIGLCRLAAQSGTDAVACYYGDISHQENRALVNVLDYNLRNLTEDDDLSEFAGFALVDHSRPGINDGLPEGMAIDIVVDHHPPRAPVEARFVDLRSSVGATSTLIAGYLDQLGLEPSPELATGLLYGIRTDTKDFRREVSLMDFEAAAGLVEQADGTALQRIESPSVTADTLETIASAVANRRLEEDVLTTGVGDLPDRDALAQAADILLTMEGVSTTLVFGHTDGTVYVSARSRGTDLDLGEILRDAYGQIGSAGGHADMAGAQIPVGMLVESPDDEDHDSIVEEVVTDRFFEAMGIEPDPAAAAVYADFLGTDSG